MSLQQWSTFVHYTSNITIMFFTRQSFIILTLPVLQIKNITENISHGKPSGEYLDPCMHVHTDGLITRNTMPPALSTGGLSHRHITATKYNHML